MNRARRRAPRNLCNDCQCHGQRVVVSGGPDKQTDSCNLKQEQTEQIVGPGRSQLVVINKLSFVVNAQDNRVSKIIINL